jgi:hypothetical protein
LTLEILSRLGVSSQLAIVDIEVRRQRSLRFVPDLATGRSFIERSPLLMVVDQGAPEDRKVTTIMPYSECPDLAHFRRAERLEMTAALG